MSFELIDSCLFLPSQNKNSSEQQFENQGIKNLKEEMISLQVTTSFYSAQSRDTLLSPVLDSCERGNSCDQKGVGNLLNFLQPERSYLKFSRL